MKNKKKEPAKRFREYLEKEAKRKQLEADLIKLVECQPMKQPTDVKFHLDTESNSVWVLRKGKEYIAPGFIWVEQLPPKQELDFDKLNKELEDRYGKDVLDKYAGKKIKEEYFTTITITGSKDENK